MAAVCQILVRSGCRMMWPEPCWVGPHQAQRQAGRLVPAWLQCRLSVVAACRGCGDRQDQCCRGSGRGPRSRPYSGGRSTAPWACFSKVAERARSTPIDRWEDVKDYRTDPAVARLTFRCVASFRSPDSPRRRATSTWRIWATEGRYAPERQSSNCWVSSVVLDVFPAVNRSASGTFGNLRETRPRSSAPTARIG